MKLVIKICGITTPDDAVLCAQAGADRLGMIFADGPRLVSIKQAQAIAEAVPGMSLTGVFRGADLDRIRETVTAANLTHVQLHDCPDPTQWERIATACERPVIPALLADQCDTVTDSTERYTLLLDLAKDPELRSAKHVEELHRAAAELARRGRPVMIAGGLDPKNVGLAIHKTRCEGVDVARGVELSPGVKDPQLVKQFIQTVRSMEYGHVH